VLGLDVLDDRAVGSADDERHAELTTQVGVEVAGRNLLGVRNTRRTCSEHARPSMSGLA
jgi:hypothetical protein